MSTAVPELIIEAGHTERNYWRDLFRYRELFYFLAWRDVLVRYKQTVIGILWAVLRPLLTMIVFTFVFSRIAKLPSGGIPYPVLVFAAMLPWQLFATSLKTPSTYAESWRKNHWASTIRKLYRSLNCANRPGSF